MATMNPFDLLGEDDSEDPAQLVASLKVIVPKSVPAPAQTKTSTQLKQPSKTLPSGQAESKFESGRGSHVDGHVPGRERGASYRDSNNNKNSYGNKAVSSGHDASNGWTERRGANGGSRGGRRNGYNNREAVDGDRGYDRQHYNIREAVDGDRGYGRVRHNNREIVDGDRSRNSGSERGTEVKREESVHGNWDVQTDEQTQVVKEAIVDSSLNAEKSSEEAAAADGDKEAATNEVKKKEPVVKLMTLEEYEKVLEEKRKALEVIKTDERKVDVKEFQSMQPLANKKANNDIFIKLGSEKDKKKELAEKEEKATKKSVSINEFLRNHRGGRGQGRGRGGYKGVYNAGSDKSNVEDEEVSKVSVSIAFGDKQQFPILGSKRESVI